MTANLVQRRIVLAGLAACLLLATAHSWSRAFLIDDAFISFRYARHLVEGEGLVFNRGDRVEGYTNFFWTLMAAAFLRLGLDPASAMPLVGILASACALWVLYRWGRDLGLPEWAALCAPAMLAVNRSWAAWATGGLETRFFTLAVLVTGWRLERERARPAAPLSAVAAGLCCLTRPEGWLVAGCAAATLLTRAPAVSPSRFLRWAATAGLPGVAHLAWRVAYYGDWLPHSFRAKVPGLRIASGALYVGLFALYHLAAPLAVLVLMRIRGRRAGLDSRRGAGAQAFPLLFTTLFLVYTVAVGGDHFEFRFVDPVIPILYLLFVLAVPGVRHAPARTAVAACLLVVAAALPTVAGFPGFDRSFTLFGSDRSVSIVSVETEAAYLDHWARMGRWIGAHAAASESIAVAPAGAIPWYSGLRTLDMLGINDRALSRMPAVEGLNVGHERMAGIDLIRERDITYLIGSPDIRIARATEYSPDLVEVWFGDFYWYFRVLSPDAAIRPGSYR